MKIKVAEDKSDSGKQRKKVKRYTGGPAYPAYDRALTTQFKRNPVVSGVQRAAVTGGLGAILGALAARIVSNNAKHVGAGALAGGLLGSVPGYLSGSDEAKSDYSRLLFLRRRMDVNDPGELEAHIRHPEIIAGGLKTGSALEKKASRAALARILLGAGIGGATGYWGTPHLGGYADVEPARRASAVIDATLGGVVGGLAHRAGGLGKIIRKLPTKALVGIPTAAGAGEMVPIGMATLHRTREAMENMSEAGKNLADSAKTTSIPYNIKKFMGTNTAKGGGVGAAAAGVAGVISGLMRRRSDNDILKHRSRGAMIRSDTLKYLLPAIIAGGVIGSLKDKNKTSK